jgi:hypothetical protein
MNKDLYVCPLTNIEIIECPVTTCSYYASTCKRNCLHAAGLTDDVEFHASDIAEAKGLSVDKMKRETSRATKQIHKALVLNDFLQWCDSTSHTEYPHVDGYRDPQLIEFVSGLGAPFNNHELPWNIGKVIAAVSTKWWRRYERTHRDWKFVSVEDCLGVEPETIRRIHKEFKAAEQRSVTTTE